jgi:hypothetical protein
MKRRTSDKHIASHRFHISSCARAKSYDSLPGVPKEFRLYPRRPRARRSSLPRIYCSAYLLMLRYAREMRAQRRKPRALRPVPSRPYNQRCAVRVTYAKNGSRGQWRAHGRYIARETASQGRAVEAGFNATEHGMDVGDRLGQWQYAGDERMWKLIVSPEVGDRVDLVQLTRDLMQRMERDLDTRLEWVAASHFNTDNPHVHIALRGVREDGTAFRLERDYVQHGIRGITEDLCTRELGYRTSLDIAEAQRREVSQHRFTSLDRAIGRDKPKDSQALYFMVRRTSQQPKHWYVIERLKTLESMGLAEAAGSDQWLVRQDFETALRAMQRLGDRQKVLAAHGVLVSDTRLPLVMFDLRRCTALEGRILVHGEDEGTGRSFMILEGTDAKVHCIYNITRQRWSRRAVAGGCDETGSYGCASHLRMADQYSKWRNSAIPRDLQLIGIIMKKRFSGSRTLGSPVLTTAGAAGWRMIKALFAKQRSSSRKYESGAESDIVH